MNPELSKYVETARAQGATNEAIKAQLLKSGWAANDIDEALSPLPAAPSGIRLPPPPVPRFGMWVSFQHIIFFFTLYISATALGGILFQVVDNIFPDTLNSYGYLGVSNGGINSYLLHTYAAMLLVTFPIFAVFYVLLRRQLINNPGVRNLRSRKFLVYLTMTIAFITMVIDLITDVFGYLQGTETTRAVGHSLVIILIAGSIFVWLLLEVREDRRATQ